MNHNGRWPTPPDRWPENLTETEAALYLRLDLNHSDPENGVRSLRHIRRTHRLPSRRVGRRVLIARAVLDAWLAGGETRIDSPEVTPQVATAQADSKGGVTALSQTQSGRTDGRRSKLSVGF